MLGHTMQSFIHGSNVYPHVVFRGNGAPGTIVGNQHSLISRQTNGQEGSQIADRALDQAVWFNTPIDPRTGEMKLFLLSGQGARHHVLKEVTDGTTPNRDAGNAISQRQGSVGGFVAMQASGPEEGSAVKLYAHDIEAYLPGDMDGDGDLTCEDVWAARAALGKHEGDGGFLRNADLDEDGVVDMRDVMVLWRLLPRDERCR